MDHAVEELYPRAADAGVSLEFERLGTSFSYYGDAQRLHQMVVNLGANAIRFTAAGGQVVVRVIDAGPEFELQVEDTGVGIPANALPHIFDAYRQAHHARGGTGLGLAIVRAVVDAHGGRVTAESQEGKREPVHRAPAAPLGPSPTLHRAVVSSLHGAGTIPRGDPPNGIERSAPVRI